MTNPIVGSPYAPLRCGVGSMLMDRITNAQLSVFVKEYGLERRSEDSQFEH